MNKLTTQCPHCGTEFEIEQSWIGQQTDCPSCNQNFIIRVKPMPAKPVPVPPKAVPKAMPAIPILAPSPETSAPMAKPVAVPKAMPAIPIPAPSPETSAPMAKPVSPLKSNKLRRNILIVVLCICAVVGIGQLILYQVNAAALRKADKVVEQRLLEEERKAKAEQQKAEAERKAKEAAEAARIAAEKKRLEAEKKRRQAEAARIAEKEKRREEMKKQMQGEWEKACRLKQTEKIFVLAPQEKGARVLIFRYDEELEALIEAMLSCRNQLTSYNQGVERAVAADGRNDLKTVSEIFSQLKNMESKSDAMMKELNIRSEKITELAVRKILLVKQQAVPGNGQLREEIPPGKYIIMYLSKQNVSFSHTFRKSGESPLFLLASIPQEYSDHKSVSDIKPLVQEFNPLEKGVEKELTIAKRLGIQFSSDNKTLIKCPENLKEVIIPPGVTSIAQFAFSGCRGLTKVTIPDSVTSIGRYAFCDCRSLKDISLPPKITTIEEATFGNCLSLEDISIPNGVTEIKDCAFFGCKLMSIDIPDSVKHLSYVAFSDCPLVFLSIPDGLEINPNYYSRLCRIVRRKPAQQ